MPRPGPDRWLFDLWSSFYEIPLVQRLTYRPEQDAVSRELIRADARRVLDLGCGTGLLASRVRGELSERRVTGCDFSRGMLRQAAAHTREVAWVQGDACRLPFRDASFDAVVSTEAFHWFPDQAVALAECHRVLAGGGRLLVAFVNPPTELQSRASAWVSRRLGEPLHWPTRRGMRRAVERAGFRIDAQRFVFRLPLALAFPTVLTVAKRP